MNREILAEQYKAYLALKENFHFSLHPHFWDLLPKRKLVFLYLLYTNGVLRKKRTLQRHLAYKMSLEWDANPRPGNILRAMTGGLSKTYKVWTTGGSEEFGIGRYYEVASPYHDTLDWLFRGTSADAGEMNGDQRAALAEHFLKEMRDARIELIDEENLREL